MHSTRPLVVPVVRLVPLEFHAFNWCSIGEMHIIIKTYIFDGFRLSRSPFYSSSTIGTNGIALIP